MAISLPKPDLNEAPDNYVKRVGVDEQRARLAYLELLKPEYGLASADKSDPSLLSAKRIWLDKWDREEVARRMACGQDVDVVAAWLKRSRGYRDKEALALIQTAYAESN